MGCHCRTDFRENKKKGKTELNGNGSAEGCVSSFKLQK